MTPAEASTRLAGELCAVIDHAIRMTDEAILVRSQPGRFDTEDLAKLLHLADHARSAVADIHDRIHAATLTRAQGADDGVILTSDGTQGWRYVRHGNALAGGRRGHLRRLTDAEIEEVSDGEG